MSNNPFTSETFSSIWSDHFAPSTDAIRFDFFKNLLFTKHNTLPLYINYGKTHTKGISYELENSQIAEIEGKVLLIYDVPSYFELAELPKTRIKRYTSKQYPGFLINLAPYKELNEFMTDTFNKSSRYKLTKYKRKLETCFDIKYKMFHGHMTKSEYNSIFCKFNQLLTKRFDDKRITNNNLNKAEWDFYFEVAYPMILEKRAGLFVIYNADQPIGVTLCYFSGEILFDAITVFDIDYAKFHLGSTTLLKLVEWGIENKLDVFDFSKGYFDYKKRWASKQYDFEYHILYDSHSIKSKTLALGIKTFYDFKQFLRDKHVNEKLHKFTFILRKSKAPKRPKATYTFSEVDSVLQKEELVEINWEVASNGHLKAPVFDFLYLNNESLKNLKVYKPINGIGQFLFQGEDKGITVRMTIDE